MKKIFGYIGVFILCLLFSINGVKAKSYLKELFQAGEEIEIKEELNGTAFLAGTKVVIDNDIKGIGFIVGETIDVNGNQDYLATAGTTLSINGTVSNDAFIFGSDTKISGNIERDLYIFSNLITIDGTINRNTYAYSTTINIKGTINGNITINALEINIDDDAIINGTIRYNEDAEISGLKDDMVTKTYKIQSQQFVLKDYILGFINKYIQITLLALVLVFVVEKVFVTSLKQTKELTFKNIAILCGKGFLILIGVPIIVMMFIFSGVLTSVGVVGGIIYGLMLYISNIFTAYFIANIIDKKYLHKKMNNYLLMIFGLLIVQTLSIIPIIGTFISLLSMLLGLGIVGNMIIDLKK